MSTDYPNASWIPTPHYWSGSGGQQRKWIILHGTAGGSSAQAIARYFQSNNPPTSVHYVIGQDGMVVQCVSERDSAWGNGVLSAGHASWWDPNINPNLRTFSIEHVKPTLDNSTPLTSAQQAASFALVDHLCKTHGIPPRTADAAGGITGHFSIDPVNRSRCPGPYPWAALWSYLGSGGSMVPTGWTDDGTTLTAPNGKQVTLGFRDYVLASGWDPNNLPLAAVMSRDPVEVGNTSLGAGTYQIFRYGQLSWTQAKGVFATWTGQELLAVETQLQLAQLQVSQLQIQLAACQAQSASQLAQQALAEWQAVKALLAQV